MSALRASFSATRGGVAAGLAVVCALAGCRGPVPFETLDVTDQLRARVYMWLAQEAKSGARLAYRWRHVVCVASGAQRDTAGDVTLFPARPELVEALRKSNARIRAVDDCVPEDGWRIREAGSERPAAVVLVDSVLVIRPDSVSVRGAYRTGLLAGAGYLCTVVRENGGWERKTCDLIWIS